MSWEWIDKAFSLLSGCDDDLFRKLWIERRLRLIDDERVTDYLDEYSARLICATLSQNKRLFLVLPDFKTYRPALLFATALIRSWYDFQNRQSTPIDEANHQRILYFGSTVGIRTQLQQVKAGDLNLAEVFQQQHVGRKTGSCRRKKTTESSNSTLPEVITIYAPVDPTRVIEEYKPNWIAVDCHDAAKLSWLRPLIQGSIQQNISIIAWGQNPLSECVVNFAEQGQVFIWPVQASSNKLLTLPIRKNLRLASQKVSRNSNWTHIFQSTFTTGVTTQIQPIVVAGTAVDLLETSFRKVYHHLARSSQQSFGRLAQDTLRLHWKYLRSLESLSIPLDFYEAESTQFWGMKSFEQLHKECEHFRNACYETYPALAIQLEEANALLEAIQEHLQTDGSPLWRALSNLLIKEPPAGEAHLITFPSRARKRLFLFALLARHNLTEEDICSLKTWVFSLDELRLLSRQKNHLLEIEEFADCRSLDKTLGWHPLLVGLPSPLLTPKLLPILLQKTVDVLLYPHQTAALARQTDEWTRKLNPDLCKITEVLSSLSGLPRPQQLPKLPLRLNLTDLVSIDAGSGVETKHLGSKPLWQPTDPVTEVARLMQEDDLSEDESGLTEPSSGIATAREKGLESWCQKAIEVHFEQGWYACFAGNDSINVIVTTGSTGQKTDERFVESLKPGDRIVAIPGQRRQNLYDLIISRVHGHPTIELHLALIHRWQEDFMAAYQRWHQYGVRNLDELLRQMQELGCTLTSSFTLRQWLWGNTLCPEHPEDLRRLAEVLDMEFVRSYYSKIHQAAKRLRGLHRGLSRRLNSWLEQQATGLVGKRDEDVIDEELGLTFSDFRNSLLILRVEKVQSIQGLFLRESLGKFERNL